jgi:hypothetical protein
MNDYKFFKPVEIIIRGLGRVKKNRGDEPIHIIIIYK